MQTVKVIEPRVNIKEDLQKNHIVISGANRVTHQRQVADSYNATQALFTIFPPSTHTVVDRQLRIRMYVNVKATGGGVFQLGTNDAPRSFPVNSILDNLLVNINNESISDNVADKIHALLRYGQNVDGYDKSWSSTPNMHDQYINYSDWQTYGSAKNCLSDYGENALQTPRGGYYVEVVSPTELNYVFTEAVILSPFYDGLGLQQEGMVNVNQINLSFRWKPDLSLMWSHATSGDPLLTGVDVTFPQAPEILVSFLTPDLTQQMPQLQTLPYMKSQDYLKSVNSMQIGETRRVVSDSVRLSQIPRRAVLFCREARNDFDFTKTNTYGRIDRLSVLWNNESGLFTNATPQDLWEMSVRRGCNLSWTAWNKHVGSVLAWEFGTDLGLLDNESAGSRGEYNIQIEIDVTNISGRVINYEYYTLLFMEGHFEVFNNGARASLGNLTADVVLGAKASPELDHNTYDQLTGDGFFSSLKSFINKVSRGVEKGADVAGRVVGQIPALQGIAPTIGAVSSGAKLARQLSGGRISGGQMMMRNRRRR